MFIFYIDDGSIDNTWEIIETLSKDDCVNGLKLSTNFGHQYALLAGISSFYDKSDALITIDADLQDDIGVIDDMIAMHLKGYEVVYGVRAKRDTDTFFKRFTAQSFYKLQRAMGVKSVYNHADYRLMSHTVSKYLLEFKEVHLFLRGIIPLIGFKHANIYYDRAERFAGESKYPFHKMLNFALNGILSFSSKPLRLITLLGFFISFLSVVCIVIILINKLWFQTTVGWSSLAVSIFFMGGIQMLSIGIIGEYIAKIYEQSKNRPRFIIEKIIKKEDPMKFTK